MRAWTFIFSITLGLTLLTSCHCRMHEKKNATATDSGNIVLSKDELKGMKLFMVNCNRYHPAGDKGIGKSIVNSHLPDAAIHFQVRHGLGDMPSFNQDQLTDAEVDKIVSFIHILKTNR